jgi:hypothetical protein
MTNRLCFVFVIFLFVVLPGKLLAQVQVQTQVNPQVQTQLGPFYPKPYSFRSMPSNYDPYQFNWYSGRWDYVPIPYDSDSSGSVYAPPPPQSVSAPVPAAPTPPSATVPPTNASVPSAGEGAPDDTELWSLPTTRPMAFAAPRDVTFEGRIVAIKAMNLRGQMHPHVLLRLRNDKEAMGTVDVGWCLQIPELPVGNGPDSTVKVVGQLGEVDNSLVLFAHKISFGPRTFDIDRSRGN